MRFFYSFANVNTLTSQLMHFAGIIEAPTREIAKRALAIRQEKDSIKADHYTDWPALLLAENALP